MDGGVKVRTVCSCDLIWPNASETQQLEDARKKAGK